MARLNFLTAACVLLVLLIGLARAAPDRLVDHENYNSNKGDKGAKDNKNDHDAPGPKKQYVAKNNRLDCPFAGGSKYAGSSHAHAVHVCTY